MSHIYKSIIILVVTLIAWPVTLYAQNISESHVRANVPDTIQQFEIIMKRDLNNYFTQSFGSNINIKFTLLRNAPTQSGIAYPKFYAWITVLSNKAIINEGAVLVASIKKERIEVYQYITKNEIILNNKVIEGVFPEALETIILSTAGVN